MSGAEGIGIDGAAMELGTRLNDSARRSTTTAEAVGPASFGMMAAVAGAWPDEIPEPAAFGTIGVVVR